MRPLVVAIVLATLVACDSDTPTRPDGSTKLTGITLTGDTQFSELDQVHALTATAQAGNAPARDVTAEAAWQSSNTTVVTVASRGEATSVGFGHATVIATYRGIRGVLDVNVALGPGKYRLGIVAATACRTLPDWGRHREYSTTIAPTFQGSTLVVELQPGRMAEFPATVNGTKVEFDLYRRDDPYGDEGFPFTEWIDRTRSIQVVGRASGTAKGATITGRISGWIETTNSQTAATHVCERSDHTFSLVRR